MGNTVFQQVLIEREQGHETRQPLLVDLQIELGRPVISYFTSLKYPVTIDEGDDEMIEDLLRTMELKSGIALIINSPGGSGLAAERIINVLRSYSGPGDFWAIVLVRQNPQLQ